MAGMLVGSFVFGLMADRFGRLLTLVASATVLAGAGTLSAILPASMPLFTTLRYYMGLNRRHGENEENCVKVNSSIVTGTMISHENIMIISDLYQHAKILLGGIPVGLSKR